MIINNRDLDQVIDIMIAETGAKSRAQLAARVGIKDVSLRASITRRTLRLADFIRIADELGYDVNLTRRDLK